MTTRSTKPAWSIGAVDFGRSLKGFGVNLLVKNIEAATVFASKVLGAEIVYWNEDFAVVRVTALDGSVSQWMLHSDHTYSDHRYLGIVQAADPIAGRGAGAELHLYNLDPDALEARANAVDGDHHVLAGCLNKPHGLRECYILDADGYCWVVSRPLRGDELL